MDEVYLFDEAAKLHMGKAELGGKGYGLVEMTRIGLPVPEGIIITTKMCNKFFSEKKLWQSIIQKIKAKMKALESKTGKEFGNPKNPLLVSVRSGAPLSMPGMMDTVLNLGINDTIAEAIASRLGSKFAFDTYRRFIQLFGSIVLKIDKEKFEAILEKSKASKGIKNDSDLSGDDLRHIVSEYKMLVRRETGKELEQDPEKQLFMAIQAVFESWWNKRASEYRRIYNIPDSLGTAVSIVRMVYGNYNANSGTGVAFTRDPSTGERTLYAEVLLNAQGEDVVAGIRTPMHIDRLKQLMPKVYSELERSAKILEKYFKDMQDIEFTIEDGKFYLLQTRNGKRTPAAAVKIAISMLHERLITEQEALLRVEPEQLEKLFYKQVDQSKKPNPIAKGLPASPGAASGRVTFSIEGAVEAKAKGIPIIMVRPETTPEDITGIAASTGVLTSRGGMTSHAAVVTRGMGKPCIVGAEAVKISPDGKSFSVGSIKVNEGDIITIDGGDGSIYVGEVPLVDPKQTPEISALLKLADKHRKLGIRANADTLEMFTKALENGAEGIGLARTERMFNSPDRLELVRKMILAKSKDERQLYLSKIKPMQKSDFKALLGAAKGKPVTIRLLDAPLHEFLPKVEELLPEVIKLRQKGPKALLKEKEELLASVMQLREANPMMGQRGVRLALMYPEIYEMQVSAMLEAAIDLVEQGVKVDLEIMVSQVAIANELMQARQIIENTAENVFKSKRRRINFKIGTMIETPRATLVAADLAKYADFFSFGTNDLTQGTFAFSRDDAEAKFMPFYMSSKVLEADPFVTLDAAESRLVDLCTKEGKAAKKTLKVGVCGEHGGDPKSISIFNSLGIDYVSMSPYRVPVARLAAAQASVTGAKSNTI